MTDNNGGLDRPIGILGGTFDPIHNGHLRLAVQMRDQLGLEKILLIPSARPPHREQPAVGPGQRAKWIRQACAREPGLWLDDRELTRPGLSYTVETLESLRADYPQSPLCLIMGNDVLSSLESWHRWREVFDLAHIVAVPRPGFSAPMPTSLQQVLDAHRTTDAEALGQALAGRFYQNDLPLLDISGTRIRELIRNQQTPRYLLPEKVWRDIAEQGIYQQDSP